MTSDFEGRLGYEMGPSIEGDAMQLVARSLGWTYVEPDAVVVSCGTLRRVALGFAVVKRCLPLAFTSERAVILSDDLMSALEVASNPQLLGPPYHRQVDVVLTTPAVVDAMIEKRRTLVRE